MAESKQPPSFDEIMKIIAGGKKYVLGLYTVGAKRDHDEATANQIQREHLEYMFRARAEGKLILNGPLTDDGPIRGICIFALEDVAEAGQIMANDPAVLAGRLNWEVHPWFGLPGDGLR
ncbi:MAG: hypothetical protein HY851_02340 [candidate division Zixibacteria bacterium]|nr:hypothetical protein [candidate division Zixibacteria bacterium]